MRETLLTTPELFQVFNGGIVCTANTVEIKQDGDQHVAHITFNHNEEQGIVNGGHTYACLLHVLQGNANYADGKSLRAMLMQDTKQPNATVERLIGDESALADRIAVARQKTQVQMEIVAPVASAELLAAIAKARNYVQGVEATALANLEGKFDVMKHVLAQAGPPFGEQFIHRVVWKTNQEVPDDGPKISVKLLIQILALMNIRDYSPNTRVAASVYARSGVIVREFSEAEGDKQRFYDSLTQLMPHFLELYDTIYAALPSLDPTYPWADGKIGADRRARASRTPFLAKPCASKVANAFVWPVFSAFRLLLQEDPTTGGVTFADDPFAMFEDRQNEIVGLLQNFHRNEANGLIQMVGKNPLIWERMQSCIREEMAIRQRMGQPARPLVPRATLPPNAPASDSEGVSVPSERLAFVDDPQFVGARNTTERYLAVLTWCYRNHAAQFPLICDTVRGRHRVYFSRDRNEIESAGNATAPKSIPETPYWASTNHSTEDKKEKLTEILVRVLGYDERIVRPSLAAL